MSKNTRKILFLFLTLMGFAIFFCKQKNQYEDITPEQDIEDTVLAQIDTFYHFCYQKLNMLDFRQIGMY